MHEQLHPSKALKGVVYGKIQETEKPRKRKSDPKRYKGNLRKQKRNKGEEYMKCSPKGNTNTKRARKIKEPCNNCRKKCAQLISNDERCNLFKRFWEKGDLREQR